MKISFAIPNPGQISGVTVWSTHMANRLSSRHEVCCILHDDGTDETPPLNPKVKQILLGPPQPFRVLESQLKKYSPGYEQAAGGIIIPNSLDGTYGAVITCLNARPDAFKVIGMAHSDAADYYEWLTWFEPVISRFIAVSDEIAAKLKKQLPENRAKDIITKAYPVECVNTLVRDEQRSELVITYSGRLEQKQKQVMELPKLAKLVKQMGVDAHWVICGEGGKLNELKQAFESQGLSAEFKGKLSHADMLQQWAVSDICVLVSAYEGTSIALLEAMGHGCAPVVYEVSGMKKLITHGETGLIIPLNDIQGMANEIKGLSEDAELLDNIQRKAHTFVSKHYSPEEYIDWFENLARELTAEEDRSWPRGKKIFPRKWLGKKMAARILGKGTVIGKITGR